MQKSKNLYCIILIIGLNAAGKCIAQNLTYEFWPETDVWYRINSSWRLSALLPVTKYYESKNRDLNIFLQADYAWGKTKFPLYTKLVDDNRLQELKGWLVRGGFMEGWSLGENAGNYTEDMIFGEIHKRVPLLGNYLLSQRIRTELRWVGEDPLLSYRFRYRIMIEKEFAFDNLTLVPYLNVEPFWDSRFNKVNRLRLIGGSSFSWGPRIAMEGNITYQYEQNQPNNLLALNIIVHLYFETVRSRLESF